MKLKEWLETWKLDSLKINLEFLEAEFSPSTEDQEAAWELYVELLTRVSTQALPDGVGDEATALTSVFNLFGLTRDILRNKGRKASEFTKIAIVVLNQKVRPFTAKWHKLSLEGAFKDAERCAEFRRELGTLQEVLRHYTRALAGLADVEDLTGLEEA